MKLWRYPKTIKGKITALTAAITFLITMITVSACFSVFQSFLRKNQIQSTEFNLQLVSGNVSSNMKDIIYFSKWCCSNSNILGYLQAFDDVDKLPPASRDPKNLRPLAVSTFARFREEYFNTKSSDYIFRVVISTENRKNYLHLMSPEALDANRPYAADVLYQTDYFPQLLEEPGYSWIGPVNDAFTKVNSAQVFPIVRPVYLNYNSHLIGWVYLAVSPSVITDYLSAYPLADDSTLYLNMDGRYYEIKDGVFMESSPAFTNSTEVTDSAINRNTKVDTVDFQGKRRTVITLPMGVDGWSLVQILSEQQYNSQKQMYYLLLGGICLIILSLGFLLTIFMNRIIGQPVKQIQQKISAIAGGDFSKDSSIEWEHEIGDIGKGINALSSNVVNLMERRIADEQQKKELEYQILQSQINPHFLYNTLNSIKWMATIQNAPGIAEMTTSLARLMKNVSKGTASLITVREELALVKDYFLIQQYRYGGSISIEYQIESEELYDCKLHRFSLQPIIENALFHGIEPKGTAGIITVKLHTLLRDELHKDLEISITDNGIGMTPEMIDAALRGEVENKNDFFKQVGISNVNQRIKYEFGPDYGISIQSQLNSYTTMTILIPYIQDSV